MDFPPLFFVLAAGFTALTAWFFLRECRLNPAFAFALMFFYSWGTKQVSLFYLDLTSNYMVETDTVSGASWASLRTLAYHLTMVAGIVVGTRILQGHAGVRAERGQARWPALVPPPGFIHRLGLSLVYVVLGLMYINLIVTGQFAISGADVSRYDYWEQHARFPILAKIFGENAGFIPLTAAACFWAAWLNGDRTGKRLAAAAILLHQLFIFALGQRFHGFLLTMTPVAALYLVFRVQRGLPLINRRVAIIGSIFLILITAYGIVDVSKRHIATRDEIGEYAGIYRVLVIQGGVLWAMDNYVALAGPAGNWRDLFDGRRVILLTLLPPLMAEAYMDRGVNLASGLPATGIWVLGYWLVLPLLFAAGAGMGAAFHVTMRNLRQGNALAAPFVYYLFQNFTGIYSSGSLMALIMPTTLVAVAGVAVTGLFFSAVMAQHGAATPRPRWWTRRGEPGNPPPPLPLRA